MGYGSRFFGFLGDVELVSWMPPGSWVILDVSWGRLGSSRAAFERLVLVHGHLLDVLGSLWVPRAYCFAQ